MIWSNKFNLSFTKYKDFKLFLIKHNNHAMKRETDKQAKTWKSVDGIESNNYLHVLNYKPPFLEPCYNLTMCTSFFCKSVRAVPSFPALAVRPTRWMYVFMYGGGSYEMTNSTFSISIPRAIASEQIKLKNI